MMDQIWADLIVVVGLGLVLAGIVAVGRLLHQSFRQIIYAIFPKRKDDHD